jgi:hypothetical protein
VDPNTTTVVQGRSWAELSCSADEIANTTVVFANGFSYCCCCCCSSVDARKKKKLVQE